MKDRYNIQFNGNSTDVYKVFWIRDYSMTDPHSEGYIGSSKARMSQIIAAGKNNTNKLLKELINSGQFTVDILHTFTDKHDALACVKSYRPLPNIGLNIYGGGQTGRRSEEIRIKVSNAGIISWLTKPELVVKRVNKQKRMLENALRPKFANRKYYKAFNSDGLVIVGHGTCDQVFQQRGLDAGNITRCLKHPQYKVKGFSFIEISKQEAEDFLTEKK